MSHFSTQFGLIQRTGIVKRGVKFLSILNALVNIKNIHWLNNQCSLFHKTGPRNHGAPIKRSKIQKRHHYLISPQQSQQCAKT